MARLTVFLDFDGVVCTTEDYNRWKRFPLADRPANAHVLFNVECVRAVDELTQPLDAQVVLSTAWRLDHPFEELCQWLAGAGLRAPVVGATPGQPAARWEQIRAWMAPRGLKDEDVLVLEDEMPMGPLERRTCRTTFYGSRAGFRQRHVRTALRIAARQTPG